MQSAADGRCNSHPERKSRAKIGLSCVKRNARPCGICISLPPPPHSTRKSYPHALTSLWSRNPPRDSIHLLPDLTPHPPSLNLRCPSTRTSQPVRHPSTRVRHSHRSTSVRALTLGLTPRSLPSIASSRCSSGL